MAATSKALLTSDSKSLWNCTLSPGWTMAEIEVLRYGIMKYGAGNWKTIISENILPGKTNAQLVGQTQRLIGQQSLNEFAGLRFDPAKVFERNKTRVGRRKNGVLVNDGDKVTPALLQERLQSNRELFGISEEEAAKIVIPSLKAADASILPVEVKGQAATASTVTTLSAKFLLLGELYERRKLLLQRLADLEAGKVFTADAPTPAPTARRGKAPDSAAGKPKGKGEGGGKKRRGPHTKPAPRRRVEEGEDDEDYGESCDDDNDFVAPPPRAAVVSARGRQIRKPTPVYTEADAASGGGRKKQCALASLAAELSAEEQFQLVLQMSMDEC